MQSKGDKSTNIMPIQIIGGKEALFYGINSEDEKLWGELIEIGDNISIQNVLKAGKSHLLTQVIGNPTDQGNMLLKNNEAHYGNIMLHNRMINAHDQSVVQLKKPKNERIKLLKSNCSGADYLLRYYEMKKNNTLTTEDSQKATEKRAEISKAIRFLDVEGKTPLLLACKNANQQYAVRLINLDEKGATLNIADKIENRTPLHIACILGLQDVVENLMKSGANQDCVDTFGNKPFYYLTCSNEKKLEYISNILDSVNFFYGRYFEKSDIKDVTTELLTKNNVLQEKLKLPDIIQPNEETQKNTIKVRL